MFRAQIMAAALIDCPVHHCHIVNIPDDGFRMRHHADVTAALYAPRAARPALPAPPESPPVPGRRPAAPTAPRRAVCDCNHRKCAIPIAVEIRVGTHSQIITQLNPAEAPDNKRGKNCGS